jgi:hypothetical protein
VPDVGVLRLDQDLWRPWQLWAAQEVGGRLVAGQGKLDSVAWNFVGASVAALFQINVQGP